MDSFSANPNITVLTERWLRTLREVYWEGTHTVFTQNHAGLLHLRGQTREQSPWRNWQPRGLHPQYTKTHCQLQHYLRFQHLQIQKGPNMQTIIEINIPQFKRSKSKGITLRLHHNTKNPSLCPCTHLINFLCMRKHPSPRQSLLFPLWMSKFQSPNRFFF